MKKYSNLLVPIWIIVSSASCSALKMLIQKAPTFVNVAKSDGYTALHICTINGYKKTAEVLISKVSYRSILL